MDKDNQENQNGEQNVDAEAVNTYESIGTEEKAEEKESLEQGDQKTLGALRDFHHFMNTDLYPNGSSPLNDV